MSNLRILAGELSKERGLSRIAIRICRREGMSERVKYEII